MKAKGHLHWKVPNAKADQKMHAACFHRETREFLEKAWQGSCQPFRFICVSLPDILLFYLHSLKYVEYVFQSRTPKKWKYWKNKTVHILMPI